MSSASQTQQRSATPRGEGRITSKKFFSRYGALAQAHPNYEYRPGQIEMAEAVDEVLADGGRLIVEAGTGTGKTLAYLVPAILAGKRVVISTGTKALQEQLFFKDLPFLQSMFAQPIRACYMKGRQNYLCRQKVYDAEREPVLAGFEERNEFHIIRDWEKSTETGDRAELRELPEGGGVWWKFDARGDRCAGQKCAQFDRCFITEMHRRAVESDIVVVNHHLFFADLAARDRPFGAILPDYDAVIFDEAHEIEDVAGQYFGFSIANLQVHELVKDIAAVSRKRTFATPELDRALIQLGDRCDEFFHLFPREGRQGFRDHARFLSRNEAVYSEFRLAIETLTARLELVEGAIEDVVPLVRRAKQLHQGLRAWLETPEPTNVYWVEARGRGIYLQATPIDVSDLLRSRLFDQVKTAVLTSATLTVAGEFDYLQERLGLANARTLRIESPFDYARQVVFYVPQHLPDPRNSEFVWRAADVIQEVLDASRGRAFVLFTSYQQMRQIYDMLKIRLDHPMMMQGETPRSALIDTFRNTPGAVLFGTSSFWQGIDVQGEQLSCVIVDRLPFAVPSDPVIAARTEAIRRAGGNPFYEYQTPQAALALKQGFGRLIRSSSDRGALVLLDNRITKLAYGKVFFESLPPYRLTHDLQDLRDFFHV